MKKDRLEEKIRPWKRDKRSWIFYSEVIDSNHNIESGTIDGNIFMLDCETARLSIWSEQWNTFIDVGISSLLKKENSEKKNGKMTVLTEVCIFYKGIKLHKRNVKGDAGILEVIDIKGDLPRDYINISRGNFTKKGEHFFEEELYPGLLEAVRKVLKGLAYSISKNEQENKAQKDNFADKILRVIENKCTVFRNLDNAIDSNIENEKARIKRELVSLVVSVSVLSYFARRDEWKITEKLNQAMLEDEDIWEELITQIDSILSKQENELILNELSKMTKFFNIKVYGEDQREAINDTKFSRFKNKYRFTQFFLNKNHWAILQVRKDIFSSWMSYLILMGDEKDRKSEAFQKLISFPHSEQDCVFLEKWGRKLCQSNYREEDQEDSNQQFLLNWMLQNIPTVGMFCNQDGNIRVNVLSNRIYPSIFLNKNYKYIILDRIMERATAEGIQRFSTITWQGREYLSCNHLPFNIFFVKRGYLSSYSYHKCIIPFDGRIMKKWREVIFEPSEIEEKIRNLLDRMDIRNCLISIINSEEIEEYKDVRDYLKNAGQTNELWNLVAVISEVLLEQILKMEFVPRYEIEALLNKYYNDIMRCNEIYVKVIRWAAAREGSDRELEQEQTQSLKNDIQNDKGFLMLCSAWLYFCCMTEKVFQMMNLVGEIYEKDVKNDSTYIKKKERQIDYLIEHMSYKFEREEVKHYIDLYEAELLELYSEMECRRVRKYLERFQTNNYLFLKLERQNRKKQKKI